MKSVFDEPDIYSKTLNPIENASEASYKRLKVPLLLRLVVCVPVLSALLPLRSDTHCSRFGRLVFLAVYAHLPAPPLSPI